MNDKQIIRAANEIERAHRLLVEARGRGLSERDGDDVFEAIMSLVAAHDHLMRVASRD